MSGDVRSASMRLDQLDQLIPLCSVHVYVHRDEASILLLLSYRTYTVRKLVADNSNT